MSTTYKNMNDVPTTALCTRLQELAEVVTEGGRAVLREFTMRIPAELDRDADVVLANAAQRLQEQQERMDAMELERYEIDQTLGKALGYPEYTEDFDAPDGDVCTGEHVPVTLAHEAAERIDALEEALREIKKCEGAFSRDPLTHAENVIKNMEQIAHDALSRQQAGGGS
jgi:hypothetical protein